MENIENIFKKNHIPFLILFLFGFVLYFQAFFFDFSYLDDNVLILGNTPFLANLFNIFTSFTTDVFHLFNHSAFYYRPLLTISFIFDYQIGGAGPFMYHFTNVMLHILSASLLFIFLKKLNYKKELAFLFSIIFLIHPLLTQAVAWVPGRNDSLLLVFVFASFIFFIKYLDEKKKSNLIWSSLFFILSLFTKESAVLLMPIMFFFLYFVYQDKNIEKQKVKNPESKLSWRKLSFFFVSVGGIGIWAIFRHFALSGSPSMPLFTMIKSVWLNSPAVIQFIGKVFLPFNLSVLPVMKDTTFIYGFISLIFLSFIFFQTKEKRYNFIIFGVFWFFAFLFPSFIRPNTALVADFIEHRMYVPIIGIFIILLETDFIKNLDFKKKKTFYITVSLLAFLSIVTLFHSRSFVNRLAFWENAAKNSPDYPLAHRNLGAMEYLNGDMVDAEKEFRAALKLNPTEEMAHNNLGLVYANRGDFAAAESEYKQELQNNPNYDNGYYNLGLLYWGEKKYDLAIENWKKTYEVNPNFSFQPEVIKILQQAATNSTTKK